MDALKFIQAGLSRGAKSLDKVHTISTSSVKFTGKGTIADPLKAEVRDSGGNSIDFSDGLIINRTSEGNLLEVQHQGSKKVEFLPTGSVNTFGASGLDQFLWIAVTAADPNYGAEIGMYADTAGFFMDINGSTISYAGYENTFYAYAYDLNRMEWEIEAPTLWKKTTGDETAFTIDQHQGTGDILAGQYAGVERFHFDSKGALITKASLNVIIEADEAVSNRGDGYIIAWDKRPASYSGFGLYSDGDAGIDILVNGTQDISTFFQNKESINFYSTTESVFAQWGEAPMNFYVSTDPSSASPSLSVTTGGISVTKINNQWVNNVVILSNDVVNNNASANTIADVTGLSFPVVSGQTYKFKFVIFYDAQITTTGSRWSINGPASTYLAYRSQYPLTSGSFTANEGLETYDTPSASNATSSLDNNMTVIEGVIKPSADGTVIARFASEVSSSAITAKANISYVEYQRIA